MENGEETKSLVRDLVRIESTKNNSKKLEESIDYIADYFEEDDFIVKKYSKEGKPSLVISFEDNKEPEVFLHGHVDVVEAREEMFQPEKRGKWLHGRGTADMKGGLAALMTAMKEFNRSNSPSVALMIVSDEEIGGFKGVKYLLNEEKYDPNFAISAEPCTTHDPAKITVEQKGVFKINIRAEGSKAHASRPWAGESAIIKLMETYRKIENALPKEERGEDWKTTVTLSKIKGGEASNSVAGEATAHIDARYVHDKDVETIKGILEEADGISYDVFDRGAMLSTDRENYYIKKLKESSEKEIGKTVLNQKNTASDMRYFSDKGIPAAVFGPEGRSVHGKGEKLNLESLQPYVKTIVKFVRDVA